jgi:hypothetical protein
VKIALTMKRDVNLEHQSIDAGEYWTTVVAGVEPCLFPQLVNLVGTERLPRSTSIKFDKGAGAIHHFCNQNNVTLTAFLQTAWAVVLRCYIRSDQLCFGYEESKCGALKNGGHCMSRTTKISSICRSDMSATTSVVQIAKGLQTDHERALLHQPCPLHKLQNSSELGGQSMFNTIMSVDIVEPQNICGGLEASNGSIMSVQEESSRDNLQVSLVYFFLISLIMLY